MGPVKGTYCLERRRLRSYSDTHDVLSVARGLSRPDLECSVQDMAYRFTSPPPRARVSVLGASSKLRSAVADQDTSDRPLPPKPTCLPAPALVALVLPPLRGMSPGRGGSRDTTFHDVVARFRRTVRKDPGFSPGSLRAIELLTPLSPARGSAPPSQTTAVHRASRDRRGPVPVKRPDQRTIGSAFLRQDARATERWVDPDPSLAARMLPVNVHGWSDHAIALSSRALGRAPCGVVLDCHPRPSPRLPSCWPPTGGRTRAPAHLT